MQDEKSRKLGIVETASKGAGAFVGTVAGIGKNITGLGAKGVTAIGGLLTRPVKGLVNVAGGRTEPASEAPNLEKACSGEADARSQLLSQVSTVQEKGKDVSADQNKKKTAKVSPPAKPKGQKRESPPVSRPKGNNFRKVTLEDVGAGVFSHESDRIIFTGALSDIASREASVRADAARAMAGVRHELSVRGLAAQIKGEPSQQVRQECVKALTALEMTEGVPAIERALRDRAASVRLAAVWGVYRLAEAKGVPALTRMLSDENEGVRRRAAICIGWVGEEKSAPNLLPLLTDSSVSVRQAAVDAMANLRSRKVVSALIERLNDPEKSIRKAVLGAIETITGKKMGGPFPKDANSLQRLIARWEEWWAEEQTKK